MDVRLSPEQQALRDTAAHVAGRLGPTAVGQLDDDERRSKLQAAITASGWLELRAADEGSSPLSSGVEAALVAAELGAGLADAPFLGPTLAADLRRMAAVQSAGRPETVLLSADLAGLAVIESGGVPAGAIAIDATDAEVGLALIVVPGGHVLAEVGLVSASEQIDLTRSVAEPASGGAPIALGDASHPLTPDHLARALALGLTLTAADLVGVMRGAVELTVAYATERRQYGVPVGSFQAVQHLLADAFVAMEGSQSLALHAAWSVDARSPADAVLAAAEAKAYASRSARAVCETAIQVHGGIGNTWECLAHVYLRRALLSIDAFGGVGPNLGRVLAHHGAGVA